MPRFLLGLALGITGSAITHAVGGDTYWTIVVGIIVAVLVWFGEFLDELL